MLFATEITKFNRFVYMPLSLVGGAILELQMSYF
jgi:hypothetical protein